MLWFYSSSASALSQSIPGPSASDESSARHGRQEDDEIVFRLDLADDRDMEDIVLIFEAFRSVQYG